MLTVGLTGGIGSGKSAVSDLLAAAGAAVVDADRVAREVVEVGTPGLAGIVAAFGAGLLLPDGSLDREALGRRVFADPVELSVLNAIVHPLVAARTSVLLAAARAQGAGVVVHDVPLLTENGLQDDYDVVVVVDAPVELQLARLVEQRGMAPHDVQARISRQATREQRLAVADEVIHNDGTREHLEEQVAALWARLLARAGAGP